MRIRSSFATAVAAAVSAVVFSAAFQPAEAALVTIDNFTQATGTNSASGSNGPNNDGGVEAQLAGSLTGPFDERLGASSSNVDGLPYPTRTQSTSVGSGVGTLGYAITGTANNSVFPGGSFQYSNTGVDVDLLALTAGGFAGFVIKTGSNVSLPANVESFVYANFDGFTKGGSYLLPSNWAPNQTYFIPFSSFTPEDPSMPNNFASVSSFQVGFGTDLPGIPGNVASSGSVDFTLIAVPEPTHMVFVAGVGAALGAWRLRKLRRNRGESDAAAV
jgi:hypothetical protein